MSTLDTNWVSQEDKPKDQSNNAGTNPSSQISEGLRTMLGLFTQSSMTSDGRNMREHTETLKILKENYEALKNSTTNESQRKIIPTITSLTQDISPALPGIGLHRVINNVVYVMAVLFSNKDIATGTERIQITNPLGQQQALSVPQTPTSYVDKNLGDNLTQHYKRYAEAESTRDVVIVGATVIDVETWNHPEAGEVSDHPRFMANAIAAEWEEAIYIRTVLEITTHGVDLPCTWLNPTKPYGNDNQAEARVNAIPGGRVNRARQLTSSNLEVVTNTVSNNTGVNANSKEIARVQATVSLHAVSFETYQRRFAASASQESTLSMLASMLGGGYNSSNCWQQSYKPLAAAINIDAVKAGEMLRYHDGLYPFFYGLYTLMVTNNNFAWAEALRRAPVAGKGSLADMETRINQMIAACGGVSLVNEKNRIVLNAKNVSDVDLVNQWIHQNCSPNLRISIRLGVGGTYSALQNYLVRLAGKNNALEKKAMINTIDSLTNKRFSEILVENGKSGKGWTVSKEALIATPQLSINGVTTYAGRKMNLSEIDEMTLSHIRGPQAGAAIDNYIRLLYGANPNETPKQRQQALRVELQQTMFDAGQTSINSFEQVHIFHPELLAAIGQAFDSIGNLTVANSFGAWRAVPASYSIGAGLELTTNIGNTNNALGGGFLGF